MHRESMGICYYVNPRGGFCPNNESARYTRAALSGDTELARRLQIDAMKARIKNLRTHKKTVEAQIEEAWKIMEEICGHSKARVISWSTSECLDCGYYAKTQYFWDICSTIIDVDGSEKKKENEEQDA